MSHFGRSGPPDIRDTYSLLVLNISFRTSADDLFPLFGRYGKVVDIFIPRDRRSGDSRGFAFVRYKHSDEAQKAVERLDGKNVDGRNISVEFAKYGRDMETIHKGRITRENFNWKRSRSQSPKRLSRSPKRPSRRYREDYKESNHYQGSRISDRHDQDRHARHDRSSHRRHRSRSWSASRSRSPVRMREGDRMREDNRLREDDRRNPRGRTPDRKASPYSSRDTSPRKRSLSPVPDSHSPEASVSPVERRASPKMQNGSQQADQSRSGTSEPHSRSLSQNTDAEDQ